MGEGEGERWCTYSMFKDHELTLLYCQFLIAQLVEQQTVDLKVPGSNPGLAKTLFDF